MMLKELTKEMSRVVNSTLGEQVTYQPYDASPIPSVNATINRNVKVTEQGILVGYRSESSFLKAEIKKPHPQDKFTDEEGTEWHVGVILKETSSKWYVEINR